MCAGENAKNNGCKLEFAELFSKLLIKTREIRFKSLSSCEIAQLYDTSTRVREE